MTDNIRTNFCATCKEQADRIEAQAAEIERLREALGQITKATELAMYSLGGYDGRFGLRKAANAARAALGDTQ